MISGMLIATQQTHGIPVKQQCLYHGITYRWFFRWLDNPGREEENGGSPKEAGGAGKRNKPTMPKTPDGKRQLPAALIIDDDDGDEILDAYNALLHMDHRSHGSGRLHEALDEKFSRREIQALINDDRKAHNGEKRKAYTRVKWNGAMTCWAMDDTHIMTDENGTKIMIHNIKDISSQYILPPVTGPIMSGEQVAANLRTLFEKFGAPLVLKRDNGSNLVCSAVNEVLRDFEVIALTSPPHYSRYNGSIEQTNRMLKTGVETVAKKYELEVEQHNVSLITALAAHEENVNVKRSLGRRRAAGKFFGSEAKKITRKERWEVIDEINELKQIMIMEQQPQTKKEENRINRKAIEAILEKRGYTSTVEGVVSVTPFSD